jgi:4,5-dihydroxyphthalate decarboxylase
MEGIVPIEGVDLDVTTGDLQGIFRKTLNEHAYDIAELSMSSHILTTIRGDSAYKAIPVFLSRLFRYSAIYVRTDRGIRTAEDLAGKRIGLAEYQQTAALWIRGMLRDVHGVDTDGIDWVSAGERVKLDLPARIKLGTVAAGDSLDAMLSDGRLDAIFSPAPPACFLKQTAPVARLYPNYREQEEAYYQATKFFPIMHVVVIRKDTAAQYPWLPMAVYNAFAEAKRLAFADLAQVSFLRVALPWIAYEYERQSAMMDGDPWPYGFKRNRDEVKAMIDYSVADGLSAQGIAPEEVFHESTWAV